MNSKPPASVSVRSVDFLQIGILLILMILLPLSVLHLPLGLHEFNLAENFSAQKTFEISQAYPQGPRWLSELLSWSGASVFNLRLLRCGLFAAGCLSLACVFPELALMFAAIAGIFRLTPIAGDWLGLLLIGLAAIFHLRQFTIGQQARTTMILLPAILLFSLDLRWGMPQAEFWTLLSPWLLPGGFTLSGILLIYLLVIPWRNAGQNQQPSTDNPLQTDHLLSDLLLVCIGILLYWNQGPASPVPFLITGILWLAADGLKNLQGSQKKLVLLLLLISGSAEFLATPLNLPWDNRDHEFSVVAHHVPSGPQTIFAPEWSRNLFTFLLPGQTIQSYTRKNNALQVDHSVTDVVLILTHADYMEQLQSEFPTDQVNVVYRYGLWEIWQVKPQTTAGIPSFEFRRKNGQAQGPAPTIQIQNSKSPSFFCCYQPLTPNPQPLPQIPYPISHIPSYARRMPLAALPQCPMPNAFLAHSALRTPHAAQRMPLAALPQYPMPNAQCLSHALRTPHLACRLPGATQ